jgi:hypothetical protein
MAGCGFFYQSVRIYQDHIAELIAHYIATKLLMRLSTNEQINREISVFLSRARWPMSSSKYLTRGFLEECVGV